jgi:L-alanine-DL-glutamate epimerase-like enolase superfamily enzyme
MIWTHGLPRLRTRAVRVNIKLDKCGGLTEGLAMVQSARELGLDCIVDNMLGTSLAMAPAFVLGQSCQVDLDGPILLKTDREHPVLYRDESIDRPPDSGEHDGPKQADSSPSAAPLGAISLVIGAASGS